MRPDRHDALLPATATPPEAGHARAARLEARLAVYAQYAAVVAEQAAAAAGGDAVRAQALAAERERVAEHFTELQGPTIAGAPSFRAALDEALAELAHQGAVDVALAQRLVSLRDAVMRGAAWAASGTAVLAPAMPAPAMPAPAMPAPAMLAAGAPVAEPLSGEPLSGEPLPRGGPLAGVSLEEASLDTALGNALVVARAAQVGGALAGQYPGRGARDEWLAGWSAADTAADAPAAPAAPRLDVRF